MTQPKPLPPGATIGILGGGQLGRMLASAATELGFKSHIFCQAENEPAAQVASAVTYAGFDDLQAVTAFASEVDVVTYEFENIPVATIDACLARCPTHPSRQALLTSQERLTEKTFITDLGIAVAPFAAVDSLDDLHSAFETIGAPAILKTRRFGYDGKGQVKFDHAPDTSQRAAAYDEIGKSAAILEGFVEFAFEFSIIAVRGADGAIVFYDPPQNEHGGGILRQSIVPSPVPLYLETQARDVTKRVADALDYVGTIAIEFFAVREGETLALAVNEFAPRVHNSGHWTIDACQVSQFENHIRAVAGWPLGSTERHSNAQMTNLIGKDAAAWAEHAAAPNTSLHLYGKKDMRDGRKMGHITKLSPRCHET